MATKKKPSAAQLRARALFAKRAKSGDFKKKRNPVKRAAKPARKVAARPVAKRISTRKRKNPASGYLVDVWVVRQGRFVSATKGKRFVHRDAAMDYAKARKAYYERLGQAAMIQVRP